jgi:putative proteasome-type protease
LLARDLATDEEGAIRVTERLHEIAVASDHLAQAAPDELRHFEHALRTVQVLAETAAARGLAQSMFEVAQLVGSRLREVIARDGSFVQPFGDPNGTFLVGGQIAGERPRLFHIYSAGNFVEASQRSRFLQLGETKYGKPILDRALSGTSTLDEAAKLSLLSFDATMRSNLSVDAPIDLLRYPADSFSARNLATLEKDAPYWMELRKRYADGLSSLVASIPPPPVWG